MEIRNLTLSYGEYKVIENLNLKLNAKITCVMADNGKGKTTFLKYLAGLFKEETGEIIDGFKNPSVCFQDDRLFESLTVKENIKAVTENEDRIKDALNITGLLALKDKKVKELSGGERRRVAIARALAYKSDCLLLDEPLKGVDRENTTKILNAIKESSVPVIMITHSLKEAEFLNAEVICL